MWLEGDGPFTQVAIAYAQGILDGNIPACVQIKQACKRFEDILDGEQWEFRPQLVERVCRFAQMLPHTKSVWASRREAIRLEPWQIWILANIFGFVDPATGLRKHTEALCVIPRKNGKSTLAAVIALYMAFLDQEAGAEVWIGANSKDQADACFVPCQEMARRTPNLISAAGISVHAKSLFSSATGSFIKSMIGKPGDGSNPHCAILDEAHENDSSDQYDTMKTGMGSRTQPLILTITTAGFNVAGPLRQRQVDAEAVLSGQVTNESLFAAIYTIDIDDDWKDFTVWRKANPNYGVSIHEKNFRETYNNALNNPAARPTLLTKHLNVWQNSSTGWLDSRDWEACQSAVALDELAGRPAYLAWDLASTTDLTALAAIVIVDEIPHIFPFFFIPEGSIEGSKNANAYRDWISRGYMIQTSGNSTDYEAITAKVTELIAHLDVRGVVYDKWQGLQLAQIVQDANPNINVMTFAQQKSNYNPVMNDFQARLADHKIRHNGNPCLSWMSVNVSIKPDSQGMLFPVKPDKQNHLKIDGIVAILMAMAIRLNEQPTYQPFIDWI